MSRTGRHPGNNRKSEAAAQHPCISGAGVASQASKQPRRLQEAHPSTIPCCSCQAQAMQVCLPPGCCQHSLDAAPRAYGQAAGGQAFGPACQAPRRLHLRPVGDAVTKPEQQIPLCSCTSRGTAGAWEGRCKELRGSKLQASQAVANAGRCRHGGSGGPWQGLCRVGLGSDLFCRCCPAHEQCWAGFMPCRRTVQGRSESATHLGRERRGPQLQATIRRLAAPLEGLAAPAAACGPCLARRPATSQASHACEERLQEAPRHVASCREPV